MLIPCSLKANANLLFASVVNTSGIILVPDLRLEIQICLGVGIILGCSVFLTFICSENRVRCQSTPRRAVLPNQSEMMLFLFAILEDFILLRRGCNLREHGKSQTGYTDQGGTG